MNGLICIVDCVCVCVCVRVCVCECVSEHCACRMKNFGVKSVAVYQIQKFE